MRHVLLTLTGLAVACELDTCTRTVLTLTGLAVARELLVRRARAHVAGRRLAAVPLTVVVRAHVNVCNTNKPRYFSV